MDIEFLLSFIVGNDQISFNGFGVYLRDILKMVVDYVSSSRFIGVPLGNFIAIVSAGVGRSDSGSSYPKF